MISINGLHLQYRLWIAELNSDITILRIFDDFLDESIMKNNEALKNTENYKHEFAIIRKEMDELRHEMYLNKMKLAAFAKTQNISIKNIESDINHPMLENRYNAFRTKFGGIQKDFQIFADHEDK